MVRAARILVTGDPRIPPDAIHLPPRLIDELHLQPGQRVTLEIGQRSAEVKLVPAASEANGGAPGRLPRVRLHPQTLARLAVHFSQLRAHCRAEGNRLRIGPFVGVLAVRFARGRLFGELEPYFRYLSSFGRSLAIPTYLFSARDVDWEKRCVRGMQWFKSRNGAGWRRLEFPVPDVVYDRLATRRVEHRPSIQRVRERLKNLLGPAYFNPGFFNKWFIHVKLSQDPELAAHLPVTERPETVDDVIRFLRRYPSVYLKPGDGSLGLGIVAIRRTPFGYEWARSTSAGTVRRRYPSIAAMRARIARLIARRNYIMQQGIPLARWRGRKFDIRILMQKNSGGKWYRTKAFARVAPPGGVTSNISIGGQGKALPRVLRGVYGRNARRIMGRINELSYRLTPLIERRLGATLGELGLDFGVDRRGKVWIIEVNSKPFLQMTPGSGSPQEIRLSAARPLRWARYVSGFEPPGDAQGAVRVLPPSDRGPADLAARPTPQPRESDERLTG